jgi:hypothetical protein
MASQAKIAANQRNAAQSTGPKTAAGKANASRNALKTGTYAKTSSLMPGEDRKAYEKIERETYAQEMPVSPIEEECVRAIIENLWKFERLRRLETERKERHVMEYCNEKFSKLSDTARDMVLKKLLDGEANPEQLPQPEDQAGITISQYAMDKMRDQLSESEESAKLTDPFIARQIEIFFNSASDSNLMFEAYKNFQEGNADWLSRQRQDIMRDLQRNYAFLDTLQHRRQTISGHVTAVEASIDTEAED